MAQVDFKTEEIAKTEQFMVWKAYEPDEEVTYHVEFGQITVHFYKEEWDEFLEFISEFVDIPIGTTGVLAETESYFASCDEDDGNILYSLELPMATLYFYEDNWEEILELFRALK